jgi:His/Glu/Gln/Arg/opine family amino acid ABC transporter permease subunit
MLAQTAADPSTLDFARDLAEAARVNLTVAGAAFPLALLVAALIAAVRVSRVPVLSQVLGGYVDAIRMTPLLLHLFFVFFALPLWGIRFGAWTASVITMAFHFGAYQSEVFRAAHTSLPKGTTEAATVLGLRGWTRLRRVTGPLALRVAIPPTANTLVELFRGTAVVSLVAVQDVVFKGTLLIQSNRGSSPTVFLLIAIFFVLVCYPAGIAIRALERRFAIA